MLRVWVEHLGPSDLLRPATRNLLVETNVHPVLAVRPDTDEDELVRCIRELRSDGLAIGVWPLLEHEHGYWPSERNVDEWSAMALGRLARLRQVDALPAWLAVDLEPPIGQVSRLLRKGATATVVAAVESGVENLDIIRYRAAERALSKAVDRISALGVRTLGVTLPFAALDLGASNPLWQDLFETPWARIPWDRAGVMAYGSIVAGASKGRLSGADARALHQPLLERLGAHLDHRAHASIGVTGAGVFGDEPAWDDPDELVRDASAARAAGIEDLAIFCLRGVLERPDPASWLRAVRHARPVVPATTLVSRVVTAGGRGLKRLGLTPGFPR